MRIQRFNQRLNTALARGAGHPLVWPQPQGDAGLTLIECLVAIVMVALVASAITPALVISVATRVQSQKAEQALTLAQSEIDRVRLLVERGEATAATLPPAQPFGGLFTTDAQIAQVAGPVYGSVVATPSTATQVRAVDLDGGGNDFAIQTYRSPGRVVGGVPVAFTMGVRVYDIDAVLSGGTGSMPAQPASLGTTSGVGDRTRRPLAVLYTNIAVSEDGTSYCELIRYLSTSGATASTPQGCL